MHFIIILCTIAAPNAGLMCIESQPIETLEKCENIRELIDHNGFSKCVVMNDVLG